MSFLNNFLKRSPTCLGDISDERARIARELHDGIAQDLAAIGYALDSEIGRSDVTAAARISLRAIREKVTQLNSTLRKEIFILRSKLSLTPQEALQEFLSELGVLFTITGALQDSDFGLELFKVIQEISRNARLHGAATCIDVMITPTQITIENDGSSHPTNNSEGFGLIGIAERLSNSGWKISPESDFNRIELKVER